MKERLVAAPLILSVHLPPEHPPELSRSVCEADHRQHSSGSLGSPGRKRRTRLGGGRIEDNFLLQGVVGGDGLVLVVGRSHPFNHLLKHRSKSSPAAYPKSESPHPE